MSDYKGHTEGVRVSKPRMPSLAGTENPLPTRRLTDSFFKLINEEWQLQIIYLKQELERLKLSS
jgi:hypothetical protein